MTPKSDHDEDMSMDEILASIRKFVADNPHDDSYKQEVPKRNRQESTAVRPIRQDIENRQQILNQLEKQFQKDYPDCNLYAFGSFYNGFGFSQSDLDVCLVFKDEREQNVCI